MAETTEKIDDRVQPVTLMNQKAARKPRPILTVGMAVHEDFPGVAYTITNILLTQSKALPYIEFVVVDNSPRSVHTEDTRIFVEQKIPKGHYCAFAPYTGTCVKNQVIAAAETEYVLCLDSHVLLYPGALEKLVGFLRQIGGDCNDMFQGPLINEMGGLHATHMNPAFRGGNIGTWGSFHGDRILKEIYEVPLHGMGLFMTRRDTWPGYHNAMHHFANEEGYIHEKFRLLGRKCWGLPFLKWWHLFRKSSRSANYVISNEHKFRNMLIAWSEINMSLEFPEQCWRSSLNDGTIQYIKNQVRTLNIQPLQRDPFEPAFLGYPIRILDKPYSQSESYLTFEQPRFDGEA